MVVYVACVRSLQAGIFKYARTHLILDSINFLVQKLKRMIQYHTFFVAEIFRVYILLVHVT